MQTLILAGGFATRLWPLTETRAKPLLPVAGKPIIEYLVDKIPADLPITVSTNAAFEPAFREWIATLERAIKLQIEGTTHDDHKLGALGATALWIEREKIDDDILLLTGDNYLGFAMETFLQSFEPGTPLLAAFDIGDIGKASAFGTILRDSNDETSIIGFEEKPREPKTTLVSSGCCVIPKNALPILIEYAREHPDNIGGVFEEFLRRGLPVHCFRFEEPWIDIGNFEAYLEAHRLLIGERTEIVPSANVAYTETNGTVYVGERSAVTNSVLTDCVIFEDCTIEDCVLQRCVVDRGSQLKGIDLSGKMLRAGTILERR